MCLIHYIDNFNKAKGLIWIKMKVVKIFKELYVNINILKTSQVQFFRRWKAEKFVTLK